MGVALTAGSAFRVENRRTISSFRLGFLFLFCLYRWFVSTAVTADVGVFSKFLAATKLATICGICVPHARTQPQPNEPTAILGSRRSEQWAWPNL